MYDIRHGPIEYLFDICFNCGIFYFCFACFCYNMHTIAVTKKTCRERRIYRIVLLLSAEGIVKWTQELCVLHIVHICLSFDMSFIKTLYCVLLRDRNAAHNKVKSPFYPSIVCTRHVKLLDINKYDLLIILLWVKMLLANGSC